MESKTAIISLAIVTYLSVVRLLRWRRYNEIHEKYGKKIDSLTPQEAQNVMLGVYLRDMPGLLDYAVSFALFKTYSIPSISRLLARTKEFSSKATISRRYADTELLISSWLACPVTGHYEVDKKSDDRGGLDPRAAIAIARVNWLHSKYNISNDDFLFTLSLFILEPISWCERYGWRALSPLECRAHFVFWTEIGKHMGIKDIPETLEEFKTWSQACEAERMVPATSNRELANFTIDEMLHAAPEAFGIRGFLKRLVICLLSERVRIGMMQPEQPWYLHALVKCVMYSVAFGHRYLSLPRVKDQSIVDLVLPKTSARDGAPVRMYPTKWRAKPWYKPESKGVFGQVLDRLSVRLGIYDDMPGPRYKSEGYRLEELGPIHMEKSGHEAVMKMAAEIQGCPITGALALPLAEES